MSKKHSVITLICSVCLLLFFVFFFRHMTRDESVLDANYHEEYAEYAKFRDLSEKEAAVCAAAENALALLHSHSRGKLSEANKQTYDVLEAYFSSSLAEGKYILYEEPLAPLTGTQSQLPVVLSEYRFYDAAD